MDCDFVLNKPYLPSTTALADLEAIPIVDLQRDTRHIGRVLWLQGVKDALVVVLDVKTVFRMADEAGIVKICLEVPLADRTMKEAGMLASPATAVAIKEPFYTMSEHGMYVIRLDHLSDMLVLPLPHDLAPETFNLGAPRCGHRTAASLKLEGNEILQSGNPTAAIISYDQALRLTTAADCDLKRDVLRNRAEAHLRLAQYDGAKEDALAALGVANDTSSRRLDAKALFRAARACYELGEYQQAIDFAVSQQEIMAGEKHGKALLGRAQERQREQASGQYNFDAIVAGLGPEGPHVDAASHTTKTFIETEGTLVGRGIFAAEDIAEGKMVVFEKAICVAYRRGETAEKAWKLDKRTGEETPDNIGLWRDLTSKLMRAPSQLSRVTRLQGVHKHQRDYKGLGQTQLMVDGQPVIDTFQLHDIVVGNRLQCKLPTQDDAQKS